jgi:hypothetical protein
MVGIDDPRRPFCKVFRFEDSPHEVLAQAVDWCDRQARDLAAQFNRVFSFRTVLQQFSVGRVLPLDGIQYSDQKRPTQGDPSSGSGPRDTGPRVPEVTALATPIRVTGAYGEEAFEYLALGADPVIYPFKQPWGEVRCLRLLTIEDGPPEVLSETILPAKYVTAMESAKLSPGKTVTARRRDVVVIAPDAAPCDGALTDEEILKAISSRRARK